MGRPSLSSATEVDLKPIRLTAVRGVVQTSAAAWEATSTEPWLRLELDIPAFAGSWIELIYDVGLSDVVTRPLLRCVTPDGPKDQILPGAMLGRAFWIGKISASTSEILVSPAKARGPFAFRVVAARKLSVAQLAARGWGARPKYLLLGLGNGLIGDSFLSERHFRRALHSTPIKAYSRWAEARRRPPEWDGFDALPPASATGPHIRVIAASGEPSFLARLTAQLRAQPWPHWSLSSPKSGASDRIVGFENDASLAECLTGLGPSDLVLAIRPEEHWAPETLAAAGAAALRDNSDVYYGDEEIDPEIGLRLKADWSPILRPVHGSDRASVDRTSELGAPFDWFAARRRGGRLQPASRRRAEGHPSPSRFGPLHASPSDRARRVAATSCVASAAKAMRLDRHSQSR